MAEEAGTPAPARRRWRTVDGIVLLDKPEGLSSNQALQRVRRALQAGKAGHAGTLDPMATGMLPLCFGQATKACGALLGRRKAYRATVRLGAATDTGDREGRVSRAAAVPSFDGGDLRRVATSLQGERLQVPPMYSALKRDGRPLYELARRGETVNRAARPIAIESLQLDRVDDTTLALAVTCSKGTYVRVLAEEVAAGLGTVGHLVGLRRSWVEPFEGASMVTLEEVERALAGGAPAVRPGWLLTVDSAFPDLPMIRLDDSATLHLRQGRELECPSPAPPGGSTLRAYDASGSFLGLVALGADGRLRVERLFVPGAG